MLAVARWTAALPGAALPVPAMPAWGLAAIAAGGLWLVLWSRPPRLLGLAAIVLGLASPAFAERPDILVGSDGKLVAIRDGNGALVLSSLTAERFTAASWLRRDARTSAEAWPRGGTADGNLRCDRLGCIWRRPAGMVVAIVRQREALAEDCRISDLVVSLVPAGRACRAPVVIDLFAIRRDGVHAVHLEDRIRVETVRGSRGERPWSDGRRSGAEGPDQ
jgi:competence protein ComEC